MLNYKEDDILTTDQLIKIVNENINYKNNKYLKQKYELEWLESFYKKTEKK